MSLPEVKVKPNEDFCAEVVILVTTLGTKRTEFNAGKRAKDLLEIKRVHYKVVDFNRDGRCETADASNQVIQRLTQEEESKYRKLHTDEQEDLVLPQIFIDGLYVGNGDELQGLEDDNLVEFLKTKSPPQNKKISLEDDNLLEALVRRERCPAKIGKQGLCNNRREPGEMQCSKCGERFDELLPDQMTLNQAVEEIEALEEYEQAQGV